MRRRRFLQSLVAGAGLAPLVFAGCAARPEPLRVGANLWPGYAPLRLLPHTTGLPPSTAACSTFRARRWCCRRSATAVSTLPRSPWMKPCCSPPTGWSRA